MNAMRFRIRMDVWVDVDRLEAAEGAISAVALAALEALGSAASTDPATGATSLADMVPIDEPARRALDEAGLGAGIMSATHAQGGGASARLPTQDS